ncbi:MAG TPA: hypothetical protein VIK53_18625 [Verrucomicrobiae bacterium]
MFAVQFDAMLPAKSLNDDLRRGSVFIPIVKLIHGGKKKRPASFQHSGIEWGNDIRHAAQARQTGEIRMATVDASHSLMTAF